MKAIESLKQVVNIAEITSIIYQSGLLAFEYSIAETLSLLEEIDMSDVPEDLEFYGKDFKIFILSNGYSGESEFFYVSLRKPKTLKVKPESIYPRFWSEKYKCNLPFRDEDYLEKEAKEKERKLQNAIKEVKARHKDIKDVISVFSNMVTECPNLFDIFSERGNYYIVLPKGIKFNNSVGIFKKNDESHSKLRQLSNELLQVIDYSGYAIFPKNEKPLRVFGGGTYDFTLSKYAEENPHLAEVTLDYYKDYKNLVTTFIKSDKVYPVIGIAWDNTIGDAEVLMDKVQKELKELFQ